MLDLGLVVQPDCLGYLLQHTLLHDPLQAQRDRASQIYHRPHVPTCAGSGEVKDGDVMDSRDH